MSGLRTVFVGSQTLPVDNAPTMPLQPIRSIGLIFNNLDGKDLKGFSLNEQMYHAEGTTDDPYSSITDVLYLQDDEFIDYFSLDYIVGKEFISCCQIGTSRKRFIKIGGCDGSKPSSRFREFKNIRLIAMEADFTRDKKAGVVNTIGLHMLQKYRAPVPIPTDPDQSFAVVGVTTQFTKSEVVISTYASRMAAVAKMSRATLTTSFSAEASASVSGFGASVSATVSASLGLQKTNSQSTNDEIESTIAETKTFIKEVKEGFVGLDVVQIQIYEEANGQTWMLPVSGIESITIPIDSDLDMGVYDLTSMLSLQLPAVADRLTQKNGLDWFPKN